jgi:prepilin-type N-terminal cleavage/methylation domain-containing protein
MVSVKLKAMKRIIIKIGASPFRGGSFNRIPKRAVRGFTLVEILTVLSIVAILAVLSMPAVSGLQQSGNFDKSLYSISDSLNLARSYAVAENTYVYVGLTEVDRTQSPSASPQNPGMGRVAMSIVATSDGTSDATSWNTTGTTGSNLQQVRQVQTFDGFHIASTAFPTTATGGMARPTNVTTTPLLLPAANSPALPFSLPLGSTSSSGKYNFSNINSQVICFNPQGQALIPTKVAGAVVLQPAQWLELDVQPMKGTATPATLSNAKQGNQAALIVGGVSGSVTIYRP